MADSSVNESRALLEARVRRLVRDVAQARDALDQFLPELRRRVEIRLGTAIARYRREIDELRQLLADPEEDQARLWGDLHTLEVEIDELVDECLVLLHGSALRQPRGDGTPGLDDGYCALADAVIDELVTRTPMGCWSSFTVLGRAERFSLTTQAITVRYPGASLWDLPVVAHELGHFVGPLLVEREGRELELPLQTLAEKYDSGDPRSWSWLQELFADVFAAYMIGPAYGFTCVALGFDPLLAHISGETHPRGGVRVGAIADTLRLLQGTGIDWAAKEVERLWAGLVGTSEAPPAEGNGDRMDEWVPELTDLLRTSLPVSGYDGFAEAQRLSPGLADEGTGQPAPETSTTLADVLNAAWLARLNAPTLEAVDQIEQRALDMCRGITVGSG